MNADEVTFLNLQDRFLMPDGSINQAMYSDGLHLSAEGYQAWADGLAPIIQKFIPPKP